MENPKSRNSDVSYLHGNVNYTEQGLKTGGGILATRECYMSCIGYVTILYCHQVIVLRNVSKTNTTHTNVV